ncbi:MAG: hypothetical protein JW809_02825 [Pirellulales bacterium]|nr:hypothetical protein [Pirellulales bacterium]
MSIRVTCPNGHQLRVKDACAGKTGLCPVCKAKVHVPDPNGSMSEDDIISVLGPHEPGNGSHLSAAAGESRSSIGSRSGIREGASPPKKSCNNCNREIAAGTHICPFCRTYIANLSDL